MICNVNINAIYGETKYQNLFIYGQFAVNPPQKVPKTRGFALFFQSFSCADRNTFPDGMIINSKGN